MTRRIWCALSLGLLLACTHAADPSSVAPAVQFENAPRRPGVPAIAVFAPATPHTRALWGPMVGELQETFDLVTVTIDQQTRASDLSAALREIDPACAILVDNRTVALYRMVQAAEPDADFPPAVIVMASFLSQTIASVKRATGIAYEVPVITSVVALREIVDRTISKVGVVHRPAFAEVVAAQGLLAARESIEVVPVVVDQHPSPTAVGDAIDQLVSQEKVDALWVLNDNGLLNSELVVDGWLEELGRHTVPVVVGVDVLVRGDEPHFGSFAVLPNHGDLGVQTAELVYELYENDWELTPNQVTLPLSVRTVLDLPYARKHLNFREDAIGKVGRLVSGNERPGNSL